MCQPTGMVIVVDDDEAVRQSLKFALELEALTVRVYGGGAQLLADEALPRSGCLVVDYHMPAMNGVELIARLRRRQVELPAILITAKITDEIRRRAALAGVRQILEKPLDDDALVDSIRGALEASGC